MFGLMAARIRNKKWLCLVPVFILGALLPLSIAVILSDDAGEDDILLKIAAQIHIWLPVCGAWWAVLLFHDFFEAEGNELLYLYHKKSQFIFEQTIFACLQMAVTAAVFGIVRHFFELPLFLAVQLLAEVAVISFLMFFLCFVFLNAGIGFTICAVYCLYINLFDPLRIMSFLSIFPEDSGASRQNVQLVVVNFVLAGVLAAAGTALSRVRYSYLA